ncbi:NAD-P-binding protein [Obba rivulosa]|uniref:NAD-P-binding protein n=1 Tax=Obba rivulosa TaxID=1052685 RepID=A0A8E2DSX6_9APHY|nr:NAD-P-binding protein [Obba rivulosa]
MPNHKVWSITGASTGFGRAVTEIALKNGDAVVATLHKPKMLAGLSVQYPADRLLVLKLDVQNENEITAAFTAAKERFGQLNVMFNNAAYSVVSEVESAAGKEMPIRAMFEVNFWGATHVTQAAVKFFREVKKPGVGGCLFQVSSMAGIEGIPALGFYNATKFALEGISEALAKELDPSWNIKVTTIEPGSFITEGRFKQGNIDPLPVYAKAPAVSLRSIISAFAERPSGANPLKAAEVFYRLADLHKPPLHFPIEEDCRLLADTDAFTSWSEGLEFTGDKVDLH